MEDDGQVSFQFTWDETQAQANFRDYRVTFAEAATVFLDPLARTIPDPDHAEGEARYLTIGLSSQE